MPERIQLRRTKGWRKPEGAIVVARPSRWGNPFAVGIVVPNVTCIATTANVRADSPTAAVQAYRRWLSGLWLIDTREAPTVLQIRAELRGHDLACWCPLDSPCHADVLREIANQKEDA